jgi:hypothetical protein
MATETVRTLTIPVSTITETLVLRMVPQTQGDGGVLRESEPTTALSERLVTIRDLAQRVGMDRSACRKYVLRLGYKPIKQRTADSSFQMALCVTEREAHAIQTQRAVDGYCSLPSLQ